MEKKLQRIYLTYYNLLIAQDLWQAHYQFLPIIFLKKFTELNVNSYMLIENNNSRGNMWKHLELNITIATVFLNIEILKMI